MVSTPMKNISQSVGMIIPNIWTHKKCSKPPTSEIMLKRDPWKIWRHGRQGSPTGHVLAEA